MEYIRKLIVDLTETMKEVDRLEARQFDAPTQAERFQAYGAYRQAQHREYDLDNAVMDAVERRYFHLADHACIKDWLEQLFVDAGFDNIHPEIRALCYERLCGRMEFEVMRQLGDAMNPKWYYRGSLGGKVYV